MWLSHWSLRHLNCNVQQQNHDTGWTHAYPESVISQNIITLPAAGRLGWVTQPVELGPLLSSDQTQCHSCKLSFMKVSEHNATITEITSGFNQQEGSLVWGGKEIRPRVTGLLPVWLTRRIPCFDYLYYLWKLLRVNRTGFRHVDPKKPKRNLFSRIDPNKQRNSVTCADSEFSIYTACVSM